MKKEDLFKLIADMDETSVEEAQRFHPEKKPKGQNLSFFGILAALIVLAAFGIPALGSIIRNTSVVRVLAAGPEALDYDKFCDDQMRKVAVSLQYKSGPASYYSALMKEVLTAEDDNTVCSPLNTYLAFAMLAETCEGNTRKQILDMLGAADIETVRKTADALWKANSANTPVLTCLLGNSLWLKNRIIFNESTLQTLAEQYHASSFRGEAGSNKMNKALQKWTDEATGGLLSDYVKDLKTTPDTVMALLSTLYFKAAWENAFQPELTEPSVFHGTKGDTEVPMMHAVIPCDAGKTDRFSAIRIPLKGLGSMIFYLPAEGIGVNDLLADPSALNSVWRESYTGADLSLPKFKVSAKTDLLPVLKALGVTDALDHAKSDFSPLTAEKPLYVSKAEHAAAVEIDENGVTGAAYTVINVDEAEFAPVEPILLTFDRPFLFTVNSPDGSILFAGAVRNITE